MTVGRYRVLRCSLQHFFFGSFDAERAALFTWIESAIDNFSLCFGHDRILL
jgi:hypothetical protein